MKKIIGLIVCSLFIVNFSTCIASFNIKEMANQVNNYPLNDETDFPIWEEGNSWTYDIKLSFVYPQFSFQGDLKELNFVVTINSSDSYRIDFNGNIIGELSLVQDDPPSIVSGSLEDTIIDGYLFIEKTDLGIKELHAFLDGLIKLPLLSIPIPLNAEITTSFDPTYTDMIFPLSIGKQWNVTTSEMIMHGFGTIFGLIDKTIEFNTTLGGYIATCISKDNLTVEAGTYNVFKILSSNNSIEIYYAPVVANIIKLVGKTPNFDIIELELKSTTYTLPDAPNKPNKPSGPSSGKPGEEYNYTTSTTDPDDDHIYYKWDWGDKTNSGWLGPYNSSEIAYASYIWQSNGEYVIRVKAKDNLDKESGWSDKLNVLISDNGVNITITCPRDGLYFMDTKIIDIPIIIPEIPFSLVIGSVTITTSITNNEINHVLFTASNVNGLNETFKDYTHPYEWNWNKVPGIYIISAAAKDNSDNNLDDDIIAILKL